VIEREGVPVRYVKTLVIRYGVKRTRRSLEIGLRKQDSNEGPITVADVREAMGDRFRSISVPGMRTHLERYDELYDRMIRYRPVVRAVAPVAATTRAARHGGRKQLPGGLLVVVGAVERCPSRDDVSAKADFAAAARKRDY